jgi:hypothetical protein
MREVVPSDVDFVDGTEINPGINQHIFWSLYSDILTFPKPLTNPRSYGEIVTVTTPLVMNLDRKFNKLYCVRNEGKASAKSAGGIKFIASENELEILVPGSQAELKGFVEYIKNRDLILLVPHRNGEVTMWGNQDLAASLKSFEWMDGNKPGDQQGYKLVFASDGKLPWTYTAAIPLTPAT